VNAGPLLTYDFAIHLVQYAAFLVTGDLLVTRHFIPMTKRTVRSSSPIQHLSWLRLASRIENYKAVNLSQVRISRSATKSSKGRKQRWSQHLCLAHNAYCNQWYCVPRRCKRLASAHVNGIFQSCKALRILERLANESITRALHKPSDGHTCIFAFLSSPSSSSSTSFSSATGAARDCL
jgi:hypothetical protein